MLMSDAAEWVWVDDGRYGCEWLTALPSAIRCVCTNTVFINTKFTNTHISNTAKTLPAIFFIFLQRYTFLCEYEILALCSLPYELPVLFVYER